MGTLENIFRKKGVMRLEGIILKVLEIAIPVVIVLIVAFVKADFEIKISFSPFKIEIKKEVVR